MKKQERELRVVARGEHSNHCHVIIGGELEGEFIISSTLKNAVVKHLKEEEWVKGGRQVWTGEHTDIVLSPGRYRVVHQKELDPLTGITRPVKD